MERNKLWWLEALDAREAMEVRFALDYVSLSNHGTSGHLGLTTLAKVATLVTALVSDVPNCTVHDLLDAINDMSVAPKPH